MCIRDRVQFREGEVFVSDTEFGIHEKGKEVRPLKYEGTVPFSAPIGGLREFVEEDSEEEEAPAASPAASAVPLLEGVGDAMAVEESSQNVSLDVSKTTIFSTEGWSAKEQAEKEAREQGAEASAEEIRQAVSEVTSENYAVPTAERLSACLLYTSPSPRDRG